MESIRKHKHVQNSVFRVRKSCWLLLILLKILCYFFERVFVVHYIFWFVYSFTFKLKCTTPHLTWAHNEYLYHRDFTGQVARFQKNDVNDYANEWNLNQCSFNLSYEISEINHKFEDFWIFHQLFMRISRYWQENEHTKNIDRDWILFLLSS